MCKSTLKGLIILGLVLTLMACGAGTVSRVNNEIEPTGEELPPISAIRVREILAAEMGIDIENITILSYKQTTWMDSCLGLGGIAESCLKTDIDGWLVELSVKNQTITARTDWLGDLVRFEP
jgi:hypothetical protein